MTCLETAADLLKKHPKSLAVIEGHTDSRGNDNWNMKLSIRRAQMVGTLMMQRFHIAQERISTIGYGEERPIADNATWLGRQKNRRVSVVVSNAPIGFPSTRIGLQWGASLHARPSAARTRQQYKPGLQAAPGPTIFHSAPGKAVILCYHGFDMANNRYSITSEAFERQIKSMLKANYNIISIGALAKLLEEKQKIPPKTVVITIDDGWKSAMRAYTILKRHDLPFTLFLAMHYVGHPQGSCLSAEDIETLKQYPKVTFADHSFSHSARFLESKSGSYEKFVRGDIAKSQQKFRRMFGHTSPYFAFPFGVRNPTLIKALQEAGFKYLFSVGGVPATTHTSLTDIPRYGGHNMKFATLAQIFKGATRKLVQKTVRKPVSFVFTGAGEQLTGDYVPHRGAYAAPPKEQAAPGAPARQTAVASRFGTNYLPHQSRLPQTAGPTLSRKKTRPNKDTLTISAVGDIMMGTSYPRNILPAGGGNGIFGDALPFLAQADMTFGNLEGPLLDGGSPCKCRHNSSHCHEFRTPTCYARHLANAGFDVLSIANNHAADFGAHGVANTIRTLRAQGISPAGGPVMGSLVVKGKRVAVLGFATRNRPTSYAIQNIAQAQRSVRECKKTHDLVVVSFHGGAEGTSAGNVSDRTEYYLGENRGNVVRFARAVVDAGADMVLGHGPHVLRAMEVYKGKLIAYSLGNFLTYEVFSTRGACGQTVVLQATIDAENGSFLKGKLVPFQQTHAGLPKLDATKSAVTRIALLTKRNLPQASLHINADGTLAPDGSLALRTRK